MNADLNDSVRHMNGVMRRKLSLLYELYGLTDRAHNYISEDSVGQLSNIFDSKQELISEIENLDKHFLADYEALKVSLGVSSFAEVRQGGSPELAEFRENAGEILEVLQKLDALDRGLNQKIVKLREYISSDLARIRKQKLSSGAYSGDSARNQKNGKPDPAASSGFDIKQ